MARVFGALATRRGERFVAGALEGRVVIVTGAVAMAGAARGAAPS